MPSSVILTHYPLNNYGGMAFTAEGPMRAVRGVSFTVEPGEFYTLLGASGCGKTTTLRCITGL